jgi:hypothetical protein
MSMYNTLVGRRPHAGVLFCLLGNPKVPRFRDCYLDADGNITILTRTGGGNRDYYEKAQYLAHDYSWCEPYEGPWNEDLRVIPGYLRDEDLDYDSTYACFHFTPPAGCEDIIELVKAEQGEFDPGKAFAQVLADLKSGTRTPGTERALQLSERIVSQIEKALDKPGPHVIEI